MARRSVFRAAGIVIGLLMVLASATAESYDFTGTFSFEGATFRPCGPHCPCFSTLLHGSRTPLTPFNLFGLTLTCWRMNSRERSQVFGKLVPHDDSELGEELLGWRVRERITSSCQLSYMLCSLRRKEPWKPCLRTCFSNLICSLNFCACSLPLSASIRSHHCYHG